MSADLRWRGPSRALQAHLSMFDDATDCDTQIRRAASGRAVAAERPHNRLLHAARLMTTMSDQVSGATEIPDGMNFLNRDSLDAITNTDVVERAANMLRNERLMLDEATTYYVDQSVMAAVSATAESMDVEPLFATDMPTESGLIVFESPLMTFDLHPGTGEMTDYLRMPVRALGWHPARAIRRDIPVDHPGQRGGIAVLLYTDAESFAATYLADLAEHLPDFAVVMNYSGDTMDRTEFPDDMWVIDQHGWAYGAMPTWDDLPGCAHGISEPHDCGAHATLTFFRRWMMSFLRLCWQRILDPVPHHPNRAERRSHGRSGRVLDNDHAKVVKLRGDFEVLGATDTTGTGFTLDHRVTVRGHWRRQWYRSLGPARTDDGDFNLESHRLVWIDPHIRGNEGPLIEGRAVTSL